MEIKRGDILIVNLEPVFGAEQGNIRPALVIQNNLGNKFSPVTIVAPITSKIYTREFATNIEITKDESNLKKDSTILLNQVRTIDKKRIKKKIAHISNETMRKVDMAIEISLGLAENQ